MKTPPNQDPAAAKPPSNTTADAAPKPAEFDPNMTMAYQAKTDYPDLHPTDVQTGKLSKGIPDPRPNFISIMH